MICYECGQTKREIEFTLPKWDIVNPEDAICIECDIKIKGIDEDKYYAKKYNSHEKIEREAKNIEMNHDLYAQTVRTLTLNYETLVIEKYGKDVLLSTNPKCIEALSKLYQTTLLTQMQRLEQEQPKFKGLVAYHERVIKLSSELESIAPNVNYTNEKMNKNEFAWLVIRVFGLIFSVLFMMQIFDIISDYKTEYVGGRYGEEYISNLGKLVKNSVAKILFFAGSAYYFLQEGDFIHKLLTKQNDRQ
jgi:hypothetical protein